MTNFQTTLFGFALNLSFSSYTDPSVGIYEQEVDNYEITQIGEIDSQSKNFQAVEDELIQAAGTDDVLEHAILQACQKEIERLENEEAKAMIEEHDRFAQMLPTYEADEIGATPEQMTHLSEEQMLGNRDDFEDLYSGNLDEF